VTSFLELKCAFLSKTTRRICAKFFSGFRKHLLITTYIETHCTRPLNIQFLAIAGDKTISCRASLFGQFFLNNMLLNTDIASLKNKKTVSIMPFQINNGSGIRTLSRMV